MTSIVNANLIRHQRSQLSGFFFGVLAFFICLCLAGGYANAQATGQGTVSGTVTDPSGAVIVGAQVTVTNVATNVSDSLVTNSTGYFEADNLNPGPYAISIVAPGFEKLLRQGITLDTDARLNVPIQLHSGAATQTVTISADAALLNTESASVGQVLSTRDVQELTVSGSNPTWLALIAPGVQANVSQAASTGDGGGLIWVGLTQDFGNFGRIGHNEFNLDGAPNETSGNQEGMNQAPDAVGEMKMDVTGYDASIGHTLGVNVTSTTKAGTNNLHGAVRETYSDTRWQGLNHFQALNYENQQAIANCSNGAATSPACYALENKLGNAGTNANNGDANIGGPVYIPKVINGRNKFFFFFSGIIDNFAGVGSATATVPTQIEQAGNFTDFPTSTPPPGFIVGTTSSLGVAGTCPTGTLYYGQYQLYNPFSVLIDTKGVPRRTPFCGNQIPAGLLTNSAMTQFYNSSMPTPNQVNPGGSNYAYSSITPQTFRDYTTREDWKFSQKDDVFVRYSWQRYTKTTNSPFTGNVGREAEGRYIQLASIGWNHTFNDRTNLNISFGGTNFKSTCCNYPGYALDTPGTLGLPSYTNTYAHATAPAYEELPVLSVNSYAGMGFYNSGEIPNDTRDFALSGTVTHVAGRHTIRAGGEWRMQNYAQQLSGNVSGTYNFDNTYTQENNGSDNNFSQTNFALSYAAFLLGINTSNSATQQTSQSFQSPYFGFYADDTWRISPKLTVIPGLRFELEDGLVEKHNQLVVGWNPTASLSAISGPANTAYAATLASAPAAVQAVLPTSLTIQGGPNYAGVNGNPRNAYANSYRVLPRLGATYQASRRVVIRAGFGLYYDTMNAVSPQDNQDGFSANTTVNTSTTFGTNFSAGHSPLSDPFPANAAGVRFNAPVGSSAGSYYYLGASPNNLYDHSITPAREYRGSIGAQFQLGGSTMVDVSFNIARTSHILCGCTNGQQKSSTFIPSSFYTGGQQPNSATAALLSTLVSNPFNISNFSGLAGSNPAAYSIISHSTYYTGSMTSVGNLVRAYPQMGGFSEYEPLGSSHFQEFLFHVTHRWSQGFSLMGSFEVNDQHDADYFNNAYDALPSFEQSNNSVPTRLTVEEVWDLPFGRGNKWATKGWESAVFGGFKINSSYEAQPGQLVSFGNLFYIGTPSASQIKIKHPIYVDTLSSTGGTAYIQWLNPGTVTDTVSNGVCTYSGNGFVTDPSCQPNAYNQRVFPTHINGVRNMGMNNVNGNIARNFHIFERLNLETSLLVYNVFNHQGFAGANSTVTSSNFGRVTGDGFPQAGSRWLSIQGRIQF